MASSSSRKGKATCPGESEDPSIPPLIRKRRNSPVTDEHKQRDSTTEPGLFGSGSAQIRVPISEGGSTNSDYRDDGNPDAENEMDEEEVEAILERLDMPNKMNFKKTPETKNPDGRSWMDKKILADFRN